MHLLHHSICVIGKAKQIKMFHRSNLPPPPRNWRELKCHPYRKSFTEAMSVEFETLKAKRTIVYVKQTDDIRPIPLKRVLSYKFDDAGYILKFKARICVRGDLQPKTEEDNYASTLAFQVFRLLLALVAFFDLETIQADAVNAFCNSPLEENIYLYNPLGFNRKGFVLRLLRALYGLRKSPKLWLKLLSGTLRDMGLFQVPG